MDSIFEEFSKERKELQAQGKLPHWFTTLSWQVFKTKYLYQADTFEEQIDRIVNAVGSFCPTNADYFKRRWKECIMDGHAYLATPVLGNAGTKRGMPVSCSGTYVGDSIYDFYDDVKQCAVLSQEGFGTSSYLGDIRERGAKISRGGKANGVVPVFEDFVTMSQKVSQGGTRRGAWAGYIGIGHGDFWELANYLKNEPEGANVGYNFYDSDVKALNDQNEDMTSRMQRVLSTKMITGKGYWYFPDKVARSQPPMYKDLGLSSKASNLCVAPETQILTREGYIPIAELEDETVDVWNGEKFTETVVRKTNTNAKLLKVVTSSGQILECTPYHKWYVVTDYKGGVVEKRTHELKEGDKLIKFDLPVIEGGRELDFAYENGFFSADGHQDKNNNKRVYFYHEKQKLVHLFNLRNVYVQENLNRTYGLHDGLKDKYFVPCESYSVGSRLKWLAGWLDGDGCVYRNGSNQQLVGSSVEPEFLREIQRMLQTLGVSSKVVPMHEEGMRLLPKNDGSGELGEYLCKKGERLLITSCDVYKLMCLGLGDYLHRLEVVKRKPQRDAKQFSKIVEVIDEGRYDDTYCFTEKERGMGMFNGILTGQCTEITLHSDEEHTYTCVLSGMVCSTYDEWKDTDAVYVMTVFLDCLVSYFLDQAKGIKGLEKAVRGTEKSRALGLGVSGLHSYFQKNRIPFESFEAHMKNNEIFDHLGKEARKASEWMAKEWGEPEWCKGYGVRNTHTVALAPNVTSSLIFGSESQGITPWFGNVYTEGSAAGGLFRINPEFVELLKSYDMYTDEVIDSVLDNNGSCQHLDFLSDEDKEVFKTFFEIDQTAVIRLASARQKAMDKYGQAQAQSLNLAFDADEDPAYISYIHCLAANDENIKSLYYIRSKAGVNASKGVCVACES